MAVSMVIWGGTWPSAKAIAEVAAPEVNVFWRFLLTSVAFVPILLATRSSLRVSLRGLLLTAAAAALLVGYNLAFFGGLRLGLAGVGGELVPTLSPVLTALLGLAFRRRGRAGSAGGTGGAGATVGAGGTGSAARPGLRPLQVVGVVMGFIGGMVILQVWRISGSDLLRSGNALFLAAALAWAGITLLSARAQEHMSFLPFSFLMYALAAVFDLPMALTADIAAVFRGGWPYWLNLVYLSVVATAFATTTYFLCSARLGPGPASAFMFIVPTAAVLLSWLFLGEVPAPLSLAGGALSVAAVYLVNSRRQARR
jgi:drug/metabolite transporter (DMT)-like permease